MAQNITIFRSTITWPRSVDEMSRWVVHPSPWQRSGRLRMSVRCSQSNAFYVVVPVTVKFGHGHDMSVTVLVLYLRVLINNSIAKCRFGLWLVCVGLCCFWWSYNCYLTAHRATYLIDTDNGDRTINNCSRRKESVSRCFIYIIHHCITTFIKFYHNLVICPHILYGCHLESLICNRVSSISLNSSTINSHDMISRLVQSVERCLHADMTSCTDAHLTSNISTESLLWFLVSLLPISRPTRSHLLFLASPLQYEHLHQVDL